MDKKDVEVYNKAHGSASTVKDASKTLLAEVKKTAAPAKTAPVDTSMWTLKWTSKENCKATGAKKDEKFVVTMYAKCNSDKTSTSQIENISTKGCAA